MTERKTPLCPMLAARREDGTHIDLVECLGSRCAWWAPMLFERLRWLLIALGANLERSPMRGVCAKCVSAPPFPDPAQEQTR